MRILQIIVKIQTHCLLIIQNKMSFQDVVRSSPKNQSESQAVAAALFQVNTAVAAFRRLVDAIGTSKDSPDHRLKLQNTRQRILELVGDASAKLKSLTESVDDPNRRVEDAKLAKDFQTSLQEFQKLQHLASERESRFSTSDHTHNTTTTTATPTSGQYAEPSSQFVMEQKVLLLDNDVAYNEGVIEEREQGIGEIEDQIREANEIFKDLAVLVHDQSVTIDDIQHNVEASAVSTTQAKLQLSRGSKTGQSKASWCWWVVAIVVLILVILLVLIIL